MTAIRENGAASGIGVIATYAYDDLGRRTSLTRGNGTASFYDYDPVSRLDELRLEFAGTARDLTLGFAYNPAGQIASTARSNDLYAFTGHGSGTTSTAADGLNRIESWVNALGYDSKGNITSDGTYTYAYSSENLLTSLTNPAGTVQTSSTYAYDPLMRLAVIDSTNSALDVRFGYDGQEMVYEGLSDNRTRRYVHGPGTDEPLVGYLVTSTGTSRLWYHGDERGSIVSLSNDAGTPGGIGKFDEYGIGGTSRFRYTGQYWLGDANLLYYRARIYDPRLGRFLQPDPIGYDDGMNLYAYVGGDPINFTDPSGLCGFGAIPVATPRTSRPEGDVVALYFITCMRLFSDNDFNGGAGDFGDSSGGSIVHLASSESRPHCLVPPRAIPSSAATTSRAINSALKEIYRTSSGPLTSSLSRDFARLPALPDFSKSTWQVSWSGHSGYAWEAPIPSMEGYVVKVYVNDRDAGGATTAAITSATRSLDHIFAYGLNVATGYVGNAENAVKYLEGKQPCR